jgi:hypothetical protein
VLEAGKIRELEDFLQSSTWSESIVLQMELF